MIKHFLPRLQSIDVVDNLNPLQLDKYLTGYGVLPLPVGANGTITLQLRRSALKSKIGASG